jgi:serine/threonine-protein kinase
VVKLALTLVAVIALGAAAVFYSVEQPHVALPAEVKRFAPFARKLFQTEPYETSGFRDVAKHPWLPLVREAQALIALGEHDRALSILRRVHEQHRHGLIRNLMDQVQVAVVARTSSAGCQVTGLARPRAYDLLSQDRQPVDASPPSIVLGLKSAVMTWSDPHDGQRRAYAVPLDESLRNRKLPVDLTPEGTHVLTPTLLPVAQRFLAAYWDATGDSPGVYLRWLAEDGVIAGAPIAVSEKRPGAFQATAARNGEGFAVAWVDQVDNDSADLFYRLYDADGKPQGDAVRVTDYAGLSPRQPTRLNEVQLAITGGQMVFTYGVAKLNAQQIRVMVLPTKTKPPGLEPPDTTTPKDRTLGDETSLSARNEKASSPSVACTKEGCFVAWHENDTASVAFLDAKTGAQQWHKRFAPNGRKPAIGASPAGELRLAWYEGGRLTTATLGREGVGPSSKVARVVGDQPAPVLAAGAQHGEWYIAWLDYETGHREPYALRMQCQ